MDFSDSFLGKFEVIWVANMPGHVKKNAGPDEDPTPYLVISLEMKREDAMKPYDSKKSYWCPDGKGNFLECMLESNDGTKAVVMCGHEVKYKFLFDYIQ